MARFDSYVGCDREFPMWMSTGGQRIAVSNYFRRTVLNGKFSATEHGPALSVIGIKRCFL